LFRAFGVLAVVVLALAGCGSSKKTDSGSSGSSAGFAQKANAACAQRGLEIEASDRKFVTAKSASDALPAIQGTVSADKKALQAWSSIKAPSDQQVKFQSFLSIERQLLKMDQQRLQLVHADDPKKYSDLTDRRNKVGEQALPIAQSLGLQSCALKLPAADESAVRDVITRSVTTHPASLCTSVFTENYIKQAYPQHPGVAECQRQQAKSRDAKSVDFKKIVGAGQSAEATVVPHGGDSDNQMTRLFLLKQGTWKLDAFFVRPKKK
jgi:hypothetical protein